MARVLGICSAPVENSYSDKNGVQVRQWRFSVIDDDTGEPIVCSMPYTQTPPTRGSDVMVIGRARSFGNMTVMIVSSWEMKNGQFAPAPPPVPPQQIKK